MELIILLLISIYIIIKTNFLPNITGKSGKAIEKRMYILSIIGILVWIYLGGRFFYKFFQSWDIIKNNMEFNIIYPLFIQLNNLFLRLYESGSESASRIAILSDDYINFLLSFILLYFSIWNLNRETKM